MVVDERALMQRALVLAERGRGSTSPNPMVGAIVVNDEGVIVGDGYHERAGTPHAEVHALDAAGELARGATLVCTLEPCSHTGRTGPCTERIIAAGIRRVVAAVSDPNPLVCGKGFAFLREHGIEVQSGLMASEAAALNAEFFTYIRRRRPFVIAKAGVSLDGAVAAAPGARTAITGPDSRRMAQRLRAEVDAIAVGSETVRIDDPLLNAREVFRERPLVRVVFDRRLRTPPTARLLTTLDQGPVWILTTLAGRSANPEGAEALLAAGAELLETADGSMTSAMHVLGGRGIMSLLLEGGPAVQQAACDAGMIDRVMLFVSPTVVGPAGVPLLPPSSHFASFALERRRVEPCGDDVLIAGDVHRVD
jgi:diaminohydroxyphosphoribosylaminopyrimidine deaminase/5-amino-6-(5-phosphoribosylamino)uracil reductase